MKRYNNNDKMISIRWLDTIGKGGVWLETMLRWTGYHFIVRSYGRRRPFRRDRCVANSLRGATRREPMN